MSRSNNKKLIIYISIISFLSILIVNSAVKFVLFKNEVALFKVRFNVMLITGVCIVALIIFILIFVVRALMKKENNFGRVLITITAITVVMIISTVILLKEDSRYYHTINMNWDVSLPREYTEVYYTDDGPSFNGDGKRYSIFKYKSLDEISTSIDWDTSTTNIESNVKSILEVLEVPKEYYPEFNSDFKYFEKLQEDESKMYMVFNSNYKKVYILEDIR